MFSDQWSYIGRWCVVFVDKASAAILVVILIFSNSGIIYAASLDEYIDLALAENLALKQKNINYQKSMAALAEARGMFLPSIDINARYSRAGGGRTIEAPVGDLVNPVYGALNEILGEQRFPTDIPNIVTPMLREKEHETKLTLTQPLFQPAIYFNQKSKANFRRASEAERDAYARQLVADVKTAYYNFIKTGQVVELLNQTKLLLEENLRVSQALVRNDKATKEIVYRAQAELSDLEQQQAGAEKANDLSRAYFNFLLNRPLTDQIEIMDNTPSTNIFEGLEQAQTNAINNRDELRQLHYTKNGMGDLVSLSKSAFLPNVIFALDYGYEGEDYKFDDEHDFWMASFVLKWNIFSGFQDKSKVKQYSLEKRRLQTLADEVEAQISLEARNANYAVRVAARQIISAKDRLESAQQSFKIVERKYAEGMSSQIEYLSARTALTEAEVNHINVKQDYNIALAELERVTAVYPLDDWRQDNE